MKILINTFGTAGDNNPFFAVARALLAQGDEVVMCLNPAQQARARGLGTFVPTGPHWDVDDVTSDHYLDPRWGGVRIWREICLPNIEPTYKTIIDVIDRERPDAVLAHFLCYGAHWAARAKNVPLVSATLAPCWWYSTVDPSIFNHQVPPRWLHPTANRFAKLLSNLLISRPLKPVCRGLGVDYRRDIYFDMFRRADLNIAWWSPAFRAPAADDPPHAELLGFPFTGEAPKTDEAPPTPALDPALAAFLDAGPPPVVVGLGTSVRNIGDRLLPEAARACAGAGRRALLIGQELSGLPDGVLSVRAAPYSAVFPRAAAIIHHAGIGTAAEAMRAGKPMIITPFVGDQFDNALRAERLGVSVTLPRARFHEEGISAALRRVLSDEELEKRAAALGARIRAEPDGAVLAARRVTEFVRARA